MLRNIKGNPGTKKVPKTPSTNDIASVGTPVTTPMTSDGSMFPNMKRINSLDDPFNTGSSPLYNQKTGTPKTGTPKINKKETTIKIDNEITGIDVDESPKKQVNKGSMKRTQPIGAPRENIQAPEDASDILKKMYGSCNTIQMTGYKKTSSKFEEMGIPEEILKAIFLNNWIHPSPIQRYGIMPALDGHDIMCQAHTGTGKTGTYLIPMLSKINCNDASCQVIILSPARELSNQIYKDAVSLAKFTDITIAAHVGGKKPEDDRGVRYEHNVKGVKNDDLVTYPCPIYREHVVIATPGRLTELFNKHYINGDNVMSVVLDEADKMLSTGFMDDIISILKKVKQNNQLALYSATINHEIREISQNFLENPVKILVPQESVITENQSQYVAQVESEDKKADVIEAIFKKDNVGQTIIFCNRKQKIEPVMEIVKNLGMEVAQIHGDMIQTERDSAMTDFRKKSVKVIVGTEVISRGIDTEVNLVINFDLPRIQEDYVHRIGRTGRFGKYGSVVNIVTKEEFQKLKKIASTYQAKLIPFSSYGSK